MFCNYQTRSHCLYIQKLEFCLKAAEDPLNAEYIRRNQCPYRFFENVAIVAIHHLAQLRISEYTVADSS